MAVKGKRKKRYSMTGYWALLVCWFFFPLAVKGFGISVPGWVVMGSSVVYWVFVMVSAKYKDFSAKCYLEQHYPREARIAKRAAMPSAWPPQPVLGDPFLAFFRRYPPPGDEEWQKIQRQMDQFLVYLCVSFGAVGIFWIFYLLLGIAG